jgi:hypothetical protein
VNGKTILGWLAIAFVVWFVIMQAHSAAQIVADIGHWLAGVVSGLSNFFASI